jgi:hypothetical protein
MGLIPGVCRTGSVLAQRAASEGWEGQPGRPPARGTRTIGMCSFDARNRGSTRLPLKVRWEDWDNARNEGHPDNPLLVMVE